jgi:hypothetical protein
MLRNINLNANCDRVQRDNQALRAFFVSELHNYGLKFEFSTVQFQILKSAILAFNLWKTLFKLWKSCGEARNLLWKECGIAGEKQRDY